MCTILTIVVYKAYNFMHLRTTSFVADGGQDCVFKAFADIQD